MKLGIFIEGREAPPSLVEKVMEQGADLHVFPAEHELDLPNAQPVPLDKGYGDDAQGDRVFRILQKVDALLVFANQIERGVIWAAVKKARNYSMPVTIVRLDNGQKHSDTARPKQEEGAVGQQERGGDRRRRESEVEATSGVQVASTATA